MRASADVEKIKRLESKVRKLQKELREYKQTFDLQQTRMTAAITAWRKATGEENVIPDLGNLLVWLLDHHTCYLQLKSEKEAREEAATVHITEEEDDTRRV